MQKFGCTEHHVAYPRSFGMRPWTLKSDIVRGSYHLLIAGHQCNFNLRPWTLKSNIVRGSYDLFTTAHRSTVLLPSSHKFTFFSGSPFLNAEIWMHWIHHAAYPCSFNLWPWTLKSDIVPASYHLLIAKHQSSLLMPTFWHKFTFCSGSPTLNSEISIHWIHHVPYPRSFNLRPWTLKSDIVRGSYHLFTAGYRSIVLLRTF
jgi:hypothetical protein